MFAMNRWRGLAARKPLRIVAAGGFIVFGSLALSFGDLAKNFVAQAMDDPLSLMGQRSPGARGAGALFTTKPELASAVNPGTGRGVVPSQRVLSGSRTPPTTLVPGLGAPAGDQLGTLGTVPALGVAPAGGLPGPGGQFFPGGGGGGGSGGGGSIGSPGGGTPPSPETPVTPETPVIAVPEPATWLMMIIGFGAIGTMLRRRARVQPSVVKLD